MRTTHDLSSLDWQLSGWHPLFWKSGVSMETGFNLGADVPAVPAQVPGSVQGALHAAGVLPDWNVGLDSRFSEWVENRHWVYTAVMPAAWTADGGQALLRCAGLDYQGLLYVNGKPAGAFKGTHTPHTFDITPHLGAGDTRITIIFTDNPHYLGQLGYTSQMTEWKTRFYYVWDWTPRIVQIGIWDAVTLEVRAGDAIDGVALYSEYDAVAGSGTLNVTADLRLAAAQWVEITLEDDGEAIASSTFPATADFRARVEGLGVRPWQPNGNGAQPLYHVRVRLLDVDGETLDEADRPTGFREIVWKACANAPAGAEPWICCVNGVDTFLQGANWVPILPNFADVTEGDYLRLLQVYHDAGFNLLRVWGGAVLEKECFYNLCDAFGILVWQEFPLSSSGMDNWPPEEPRAVDEMAEIAKTYVARRQHHPSLLLWCGGNELQGTQDGGKQGCGKPIDVTHPMMASIAAMLREADPTRRFLPTSSTGPRFTAEASEFGQGLHHDVHGPWGMAGPLANWEAYWAQDDALFRSETGMPSCSPTAMIEQYRGTMPALPANRSNQLWMHSGSWWIQWDDYLADGGDPESLDGYVTWSQQRQAVALAHATRVSKARFPGIGGIIFWMGHDLYPVPSNNSIIDFHGNPKPAVAAIAEVFHATAEACRE